MRGDSKEERLFCISDRVQCNRHGREGEREKNGAIGMGITDMVQYV